MGTAILGASEEPGEAVFPRWSAFVCFWTAFLFIPATGVTFFHHGPFGYNGLLALYVVMSAFFVWIVVTTVLSIKAIKRGGSTSPAPCRRGATRAARPPDRGPTPSRSSSCASSGHSASELATLIVLIVAFVRVRIVGLYFMEIRRAPLALRVSFDAWCVVVCAGVVGIYLVAG
jgi:hypothetical protein